MTHKAKICIAVVTTLVVAMFALLYAASAVALDMLTGTRRADAPDSYARLARNYPETNVWLDSLQHAEALHDTFIIAADGRRLHAIYAKAYGTTDKTAVIVHGWRNCSIDMLQYGYIFNSLLGYNILLPDLNGHGLSDGDHINMGWKDRLDVMRWMEVANSLFAVKDSMTNQGGGTQMVLHGVSMGAATVMCVSGEQLKPYVKAIVEDCGYTNVLDEAKANQGELKYAAGIIIPTADMLCRIKYGWSFSEASPLEQVGKCSLPMMFIHGTDDDFVPTWMVHPLYEAKSDPKVLWLADGSKHALAYYDHRQEYVRRVSEFLNDYIK